MGNIICVLIAASVGAFVIVLLFTLISSTCSQFSFKCKDWILLGISSLVVLIIVIVLIGSFCCRC
jgi:uncharacterized membrane-anchored protein